MPVTNTNSGAKAGSVMHFAASTAPAGWLKANGALVSRSSYAALFAVVGTTFGAGDGSTTFALPDLRGEFVRSLDDGRGVDSSRNIGTNQTDALQNMTGAFYMYPNTAAYLSGASGTFNATTAGVGGTATQAGQGSAHQINFNAANVARTATETRPRNVAMLACIKY